ncbi:peptide deformylase [Lacticaseibacillus parakribbianus]|uniref:peptide deformylase n=1 Tax=Lacticaseibacillus parakribbianus TaxID=2970927 RepID=UPI0021CB48CF|nr:peptide deformylase [Lacticaseibacillus parakribbianus]
MIRPINRDTLFLQRKARLATPADRAVIQDLKDTLAAHRAGCVGMAANMIGADCRVIIAAVGPGAMVLVNPRITMRAGAYQTQEGCLSLSGERPAERYESLTVAYQDEQFRPQTQAFSGFLAQVIQHEVAHCDGVLI